MYKKELDIWVKRRLNDIDSSFYDVINRVDPLIGDYQQYLEEISFEIAFWTFDIDDNYNDKIISIQEYINDKFGKKIHKRWKDSWELDAKLNRK